MIVLVCGYVLQVHMYITDKITDQDQDQHELYKLKTLFKYGDQSL